ncbi:MAG: S-formylglutathione hydrolase [Pseudomonadota bacterium]
METIATHACFGGVQGIYAHNSASTGTRMEFSVYVPRLNKQRACAVVYYLSGLTCTWENATVKAGFQRVAAALGLIVVAPDTSPRGEGVPNDDAYDLGQGAGFYLNATQAPWDKHFRMESYIAEELPALIDEQFPNTGKRGVMGHSMGGHGALTLAMRHPDTFQTVSALSPIVAPSEVPWGQKAFAAYLGDDKAAWAEHDACALLASRGWHGDIFADTGTGDPFLYEQLKPQRLREACDAAGVELTQRLHDGYDHSYYFVASMMDDHLAWHADRLT